MLNRPGLMPFVFGMLAGGGLAGLLAVVIAGHPAIAQESSVKDAAASDARAEKKVDKDAWRQLKRMMDRQEARRHRAHRGPGAWHFGPWGPHWTHRHGPHGMWGFHAHRGGPWGWHHAHGPHHTGFRGHDATANIMRHLQRVERKVDRLIREVRTIKGDSVK